VEASVVDETRTTFRAEFTKDWSRWPNVVTEVRFVLSPIAAILFLFGNWQWAFGIFVIVSATDKLDGWMARRVDKKTGNNNVTLLGKALDPIVDKILVVMTLLALSIIHPLVLVPTVIIFARELSVFLMLKRVRAHGRVIGTVYSGKIKMVVQCIAIALLFLPLRGSWELLVWAIVGGSVALTLTSWGDYLKAYNAR
jgi:CDP-diacylglycerol--glycerol-3-phosphate 3-phosphatidyltransferase